MRYSHTCCDYYFGFINITLKLPASERIECKQSDPGIH